MINFNSMLNILIQKKDRIQSDQLINNIFWNSIARFGSAGLNFLMTLFLMSVLPVADYGEFVFFFSIYSTIPFFLDFGLNNSLVSIGAKLNATDKAGYTNLISTHLSIKGVLLLLILLLSAGTLALGLWDRSFIIMVILGATLGLWECILSIFKSRQEFKLLSQLIPVRNAMAFTGILLLYYVFNVNSWESFLYIIMIIPLLMTVVIYLMYFNDIKLKIHKTLLRQTFEVSKWIGLFTIITAVHSKADIYLLKYFATQAKIADTEVGIFSAAFSLLALTNVLTSTFAEAILPKVSSESSHVYFRQFMQRLRRTIPYVISFALLLGLVLYFAFTFGFDAKYVDSVNSMIFIGAGMILLFYLHTLNTIFYPLNRTDVVFKVMVVMFLSNVIFGYLFIPILGSVGAAITNMLVSAIGLLLTYFALIKLLKDGNIRAN